MLISFFFLFPFWEGVAGVEKKVDNPTQPLKKYPYKLGAQYFQILTLLFGAKLSVNIHFKCGKGQVQGLWRIST